MKPGIKTTELAVSVLTDIGVLAAALQGSLPPKWAAIVAAVSTFAYSLSRGIAKIGAAIPPVTSPAPAPAPALQPVSGGSATPQA